MAASGSVCIVAWAMTAKYSGSIFTSLNTKKCGRLLGKSRPREPGLGTGRGGDVTGVANSFVMPRVQRAAAVAGLPRGSPSATHTLGSDCDWRLTNR
jgi:hypothetical protein